MNSGDFISVRPAATAQRNAPLLALAITWLTIPILIWLATHGTFSFLGSPDTVSDQSALVSTVNEQATVAGRIQKGMTGPLLLLFLIPYIRELDSLYLQNTVFALIGAEAVFSITWSQFPLRTAAFTVDMLLCILFANAFLRRFTREEQLTLLYWTGWCAALASVALVFLAPRYSVYEFTGRGEWKGLFFTKNVLARASVFLLTPALFLERRGVGELIRLAYVLFSIFLVYKTHSATGLIILCVTICVAILLRMTSRVGVKEVWIVLLGGIILAVGLAFMFAQYLPVLITALGKSANLTGRTRIWSAVFSSLLKRPILGYGYGGFWWGAKGEAYNIDVAVGWSVPYSHNGFLDVWLELGGVGLALILFSLLKAFRDGFLALRVERSNYSQWCLCIVVLTVLYNLDEGTFLAQTELAWVLYMVACTALSLTAGEVRERTLEAA